MGPTKFCSNISFAALVLCGAATPGWAETFTANFNAGLGPNLSFKDVGGGHYALAVGNGLATISQPAGIGGTNSGNIVTNFTVDGNFTATVTEDFTHVANITCAFCGVFEYGEFYAVTKHGGEPDFFGENSAIGFNYGDYLLSGSNPNEQCCSFAPAGDTVLTFRTVRNGDTISNLVAFHIANFTTPFVLLQQQTDPSLTGATYFDLELFNDLGVIIAGQTSFSDFTITADKFNGLAPTGTPEPGSLALVVTGLAGLAGLWRRRAAGTGLA